MWFADYNYDPEAGGFRIMYADSGLRVAHVSFEVTSTGQPRLEPVVEHPYTEYQLKVSVSRRLACECQCLLGFNALACMYACSRLRWCLKQRETWHGNALFLLESNHLCAGQVLRTTTHGGMLLPLGYLTDRVILKSYDCWVIIYDELLLSTLINPRVNALFVMIWPMCLAQRTRVQWFVHLFLLCSTFLAACTSACDMVHVLKFSVCEIDVCLIQNLKHVV